MKFKYLIVLTFLLVSVFGCQGVAQQKNQIKQKDTDKDVVVKKNPLNITFNNEDYGTTADTSVLAKKLEEIFKDRGKDGVFRQGTNEIVKTVYLQGDRSAPAEEIAKLFGAVNASGASPILIPVLISNPVQKEEIIPKPNPLILNIYASLGKADLGRFGKRDPEEILTENPENPSMLGEVEIGFMGELSEDRSSVPDDKSAITVVADKNGTFTMDGKQISASDLKIKIESRLKTKEKNKKIIFVQVENYGNIEDVAGIAASAGAVKVYFITKNIEHKENGISFSLPPAYVKDKDLEQIPGTASFRLIGPDSSSFEITLSDELFDKESAETEIKTEYERKKESFNKGEVTETEIDGSQGVFTIVNDESGFNAIWFGFRTKDGKQQLVIITFVSQRAETNYSNYEFYQIKNSIKFD